MIQIQLLYNQNFLLFTHSKRNSQDLGKPNEESQPEGDVEVLENPTDGAKLVVFNDDVNTFDFVIEALITVCNHDLEQATQCTLLIHYRGKCIVKTGDVEELVIMQNKLLELGISAEVQ